MTLTTSVHFGVLVLLLSTASASAQYLIAESPEEMREFLAAMAK